MKNFNLRFLCADKIVYDGECSNLVVPLKDGLMGIMAGHADMIGAIEIGEVVITIAEGNIMRLAVTKGVVKVEKGSVLILADTAEESDQIDELRARQALEKAKEQMLHKQSVLEYKKTSFDIARAVNRIKVKNRG